jgi:hypothetical protein
VCCSRMRTSLNRNSLANFAPRSEVGVILQEVLENQGPVVPCLDLVEVNISEQLMKLMQSHLPYSTTFLKTVKPSYYHS